MANDPKKTPAPTAAPGARPRANLEEGDSNKTLPGGVDPRDPQYPGKYSTSENVTTPEQEAAQDAYKNEEITDAPVEPGAAPRAEQIESQVAAAENPLAPQSTTISEPHSLGGGLTFPPRPEGQKNPVPPGTGSPSAWRYDPVTGQPLAGYSNTAESAGRTRMRARLVDEDDEETEVELATPVILTDDAGEQHSYGAGKQKMPRSHSEHWYLKQHLVPKAETKSDKAADSARREQEKK